MHQRALVPGGPDQLAQVQRVARGDVDQALVGGRGGRAQHAVEQVPEGLGAQRGDGVPVQARVLPPRGDVGWGGQVAAQGGDHAGDPRLDGAGQQREGGVVEVVGVVDQQYRRGAVGGQPAQDREELVELGRDRSGGQVHEVGDGPEGDGAQRRVGAHRDQGRGRLGPTGDLVQQPGLAHAGRADQHHADPVALEHLVEPCELVVAVHQGPRVHAGAPPRPHPAGGLAAGPGAQQ